MLPFDALISRHLPVNYLSSSRLNRGGFWSLLSGRRLRTALLTIFDMCYRVTIAPYNLKLRSLRGCGLG